ncbi:MAG: response regulator [Bacteroidales bacterium]|nr:response regulator [Bacteroidales bacterium]
MIRTFATQILLLFAITLCAQEYPIRFKHFSSEEGLSQSWVKCILQDSSGFIWIGTADGLNKYDGYEFTVYKPESNNRSIGNVYINDMVIKEKDDFYIATDQGIFVYHATTDSFSKFPFLKLQVINCILPDNENCIWFGTNEGLYKYNDKDSSVLSYFHDPDDKNSLSDSYIRTLFKDSEHNLWIGTTNGLNLMDQRKHSFTRYMKSEDPESLSNNNIFTLFEDESQRFWVGSAQGGLDLFVNAKDRPVKGKFRRVYAASVQDLIVDQMNMLWVARGSGEGLDIINLNTFEIDNKQNIQHFENIPFSDWTLSDNSVICLFEDRNNDIWVGTFGGGVNYFSYRSKKFKIVEQISDYDNSIVNNFINALFEEDKYLWIGTERGLTRYDKNAGTYKHFIYDAHHLHSIGANAVYAIAKDTRGNLWIGCWDGGLNLYDYKTEKFRRFTHSVQPGSISNNHVFSICEDSYGNLWIGTMGGGLNRFDYETEMFTSFQHDPHQPNSLSYNAINSVYVTKNGELFISAIHALEQYDYKNNSFIHYKHDPEDHHSINGGYIVTMYEDKNQNLWIATNMGLELFDREKNQFIHRTVSDGLPNNTIQGILEDDKGNLWLSTNFGISRYSGRCGRAARDSFINYNLYDGLPANEFVKRSCFKNNQGYMYFGSTHGYVLFHPDSIHDNPVPPPVVITDFDCIGSGDATTKKDNKVLPDMKENNTIHLSYRETDFIVKYAALNYLNTVENKYRYKLEGYESDWNEVGNQRFATYTNIQPGEYTFMVMGSNNDNVWNKTPATVNIIIDPPWWRTLGFLISTSTAFVLLIVYLIRKRILNLKKQKQILESTVIKRTEELSEANTLLEERQEEISSQNEELEKHRHNLESLVKERTVELHAAKKKAEESDKLKSAFLANMSHEIRTPMNAIVGFTSLLCDEELLDDEKSNYLDVIKSNSNTLLTLINDILDISLIEANQLVINKEVFDINKVLSELLKYVLIHESENIEISFQSGFKSDPFTIYNDPVRFKQVMTNLLNNAIKYTEKGYIKFGYEVMDKLIQFYVSDSGVGISESDVEHIFNPFYKVENADSKLYQGAGIGLSITKNLVELMGGYIWVESEPEKGTTFYFVLPLAEKIIKNKEPEIKKKHKYSFEKATVLVAEDDETNYSLIKMILKPTSAKLIRAEDGRKAVEFIENNKEIKDCIVLMDIKMPNMNGVEAMKKIKNINNKIPVIAVTAYAQATDKSKFLKHKFDDYISKPIYAEKLLKLIDKYYNII